MDSTLGLDLKKKYPGKWVAGHLLNHKMHGPGYKRWNLTPLTQKTNSKMKEQSENPAKTEMLGKGKVLSYDVKVNYKAGYDETASSYPKGQVADTIDMVVISAF